MAQIDKNTVKADNQLDESRRISFDCENNNGIRILFTGNSITRHAPKAEIGWHGDWGMAASSKEKDYVRVAERMLLENAPDATFCVCQAADWEKNYKDGSSQLEKFRKAREFNADIIVMRLLENCGSKDFDAELFTKEYLTLINYLNKNKKARVIITSSFWKHPGDDTLRKIAEENSLDFIYLGDLGEEECMRADGLFEHSGVAAHPGDRGMEEIARRIYEIVKKYL